MLFKKKGQPTQTEQTLLSQAQKEIDGLMTQNIHIKIQFTAMDFLPKRLHLQKHPAKAQA